MCGQVFSLKRPEVSTRLMPVFSSAVIPVVGFQAEFAKSRFASQRLTAISVSLDSRFLLTAILASERHRAKGMGLAVAYRWQAIQ
jgi:hypothetical protein